MCVVYFDFMGSYLERLMNAVTIDNRIKTGTMKKTVYKIPHFG